MVPKRKWKEIPDARDTSEKQSGPYRGDELGATVLLSGCYRGSVHLFQDHIVYQMKNINGGLVDKSEDHIERVHQDSKRSERKYCGVTTTITNFSIKL